jgi:hypothetical protein
MAGPDSPVRRTVLEGHDGTVAKFVGDAVRAVFGFALAHEDDALWAVPAASEMRLTLAALNLDLKRDYGAQSGDAARRRRRRALGGIAAGAVRRRPLGRRRLPWAFASRRLAVLAVLAVLAILAPVEIGRVERAFGELVDEEQGEERAWREHARVVFLTVVSAGLRRGEVLGLRCVTSASPTPQARSCASRRPGSAARAGGRL